MTSLLLNPMKINSRDEKLAENNGDQVYQNDKNCSLHSGTGLAFNSANVSILNGNDVTIDRPMISQSE